jgi:uncharacterized protein YndB with AHSA1/START domain
MTFSLDRTIEIRARRTTVFAFFTDSARWARWWGEGSRIEAVIGGAVTIVYPGGERVSGVVREIVPDERIAFTYGYDVPGRTIPPGGSLVTITLSDAAGGATRIELRHDLGTASARDVHVQGWRHQLARFAAAVGDEAHAGVGDAIAAWYSSWNEADEARLRGTLAGAVAPDVRFRDGNGDTYGIDELVGHIAAAHRFMAGITLLSRGQVRRSHDVALADWDAVRKDGSVVRSGTSVFRFAADGRIQDVIGIG